MSALTCVAYVLAAVLILYVAAVAVALLIDAAAADEARPEMARVRPDDDDRPA